MLTTEQADEIAMKAGISSITYYPEIHVDTPDFDLWDEVDYCLEGATGTDIERAQLNALRALIARTIIDPTRNREELTTTLSELTDEAPAPTPAPDGNDAARVGH